MTSMINISVLNHIVLEMVLKNLNTSLDLNLTTVAVLVFFLTFMTSAALGKKVKQQKEVSVSNRDYLKKITPLITHK